MLRSAKEFLGYNIKAVDGRIGHAEDLLFDDQAWTIRYLVVDTGAFLPGRQVIVAPAALHTPKWRRKTFPVGLTKKEIAEGPDIGNDLPVSRRHEEALVEAYGWPAYWTGFTPPLGGLDGSGAAARPDPFGAPPKPQEPPSTADSNLRSAKEVKGYSILATDGHAGEIQDFIVETDTWTIHYLVIDTRPWWFGGHVIIAPAWFDHIDWHNREVRVSMDVEAVKSAPEFKPSQPINRDYEQRLFDYYGRPKVRERQ